ncbi:MAG: CAAX protease [Cyanophyceae cyanobacterium]
MKRTVKRFGLAATLASTAVVLLAVARRGLFRGAMAETVDFAFDLIEIAAVAVIFAAILAPLEALGWWAGWYGDSLDTATGTLEEPIPPQTNVVRYVVYLDGISQATFEYVPEVSEFLRQLAIALPDNIAIIRGILPYSPINRPMTENRFLAFFWRWAVRLRLQHPRSWLNFFINIRNVFIVAVSADQRYGPIYNQGIAQVIYKSLISHGYRAGSGVPITLIGYSGGGQISLGTVPYLKQALAAPVEVISLGGVFSGNNQFLQLEHFYHLVGKRDRVERIGAVLCPRRWSVVTLSYWNRAKKSGKISLISLGAVGHEVPGGIMDAHRTLRDGRTHLQQTIELVTGIIQGSFPNPQSLHRRPGNYDRYQQGPFNHVSYYPLYQSLPQQYRPVAPWMGRLILPTLKQRQQVQGVWFEVWRAEAGYEHLVGQVVKLRWSQDPQVQEYVRAVTRDVYFSPETEYSRQQGKIHPDRLDRWRQVDPLESLAGARPFDDVVVKLAHPTVTESPGGIIFTIAQEPIQISGPFYGLVQFIRPLVGDRFVVIHFNRANRQFSGLQETVRMPQVIADRNGVYPSTSHQIEQSPLNQSGWYIYGAKDREGLFVVRAIAPRALFQLKPERVISDSKAAHYIKNQAWHNIKAKKGTIESVLCSLHNPQPLDQWTVGTRALVVHVYGGIGGSQREPAAQGPVYFGHFAYGVAEVVYEPLANELRFDIHYHQVYTHNPNGIIAGTLAWSCYMGDRQWGILGTRPVADVLINLDAFTASFDGRAESALDRMSRQLEAMTARYRIGDGTGGTYVGPANNCAQDSNQALYATIKDLETDLKADEQFYQSWLSDCPQQAQRLQQLVQLEKDLKRQLMPLGNPREDWESNAYVLGISLEDRPVRNLIRGLGSWRTMLPRLASDTVVKTFLEQGASVWVLRTNQVGGSDPNIEPIAPVTF